MRACSPIDKRLALLPNMPDKIYTWHAKPFMQASTQYRGNVLFQERCVINRLTIELGELLFLDSRRALNKADLHRAAIDLAKRLEGWMDLLPSDLRYSKGLPAPIFELSSKLA